jgi:hypothetical protein
MLPDTPEYRYRITPNLGRLSSVHTVLPPVLPTVLLGWKRFRVHHGATLAGSSIQICSRVAEYYQRLLDQITILKTGARLAVSGRLGDLVRAIVHHLRTLTLKAVEALVVTFEFSFVALVLVVSFSESCGSRTDFCETTVGDSRIMSAYTKLILVHLRHTILLLFGPCHCD